MSIVLYEIVAQGDRRPSNYCWRTRMALAHKGLAFEARPVRHVDIPTICDGRRTALPVVEDGGRIIEDSLAIAEHLEAAYPGRPTLFGGEAGLAFARFLHAWWRPAAHIPLLMLVARDLVEGLVPEDRAYVRAKMEARFGRPLAQLQAASEADFGPWRESLAPIRALLERQPFISGSRPLYADYIVFGTFQWARTVTPLRVLDPADPVAAWVERCRDLFDGLAQKAKGAAD